MKSSKSQRATADLLRWLQEQGCPVDITKVDSSVEIEPQGGDVTRMFDLPDGSVGYLLDLRIINKGPGPRSIRGLELAMPWVDCGFRLLQDPRETWGSPTHLYRFPGTTIAYPRDMVLNHELLPDAILQPNHPKSGLLLGIGNPISWDIPHGARFTGLLSIITDSDTPATCEVELWADRSEKPRAKTNQRPARFKGLYAPEPGPKDDFPEHADDVDVPLHASHKTNEPRDGYVRSNDGKPSPSRKERET